MISIAFYPVIDSIALCICSCRNRCTIISLIQTVFYGTRFTATSSNQILGLSIIRKVCNTWWILLQAAICLGDRKRLAAINLKVATLFISKSHGSCSCILIIGIADSVFTAWDGCIIICYSNGRLFLCAIISKTACAQSKSGDLPWSDGDINWAYFRVTMIGITLYFAIDNIASSILSFRYCLAKWTFILTQTILHYPIYCCSVFINQILVRAIIYIILGRW